MARVLMFLALASALSVGLLACGGGDDDDDDDDGGDNGAAAASGDDRRTDASGGSGKLTVDGKDYTLDMETCELSMGASKLTVLAGSLKGEKDADFSASGIEKTVAIAVRVGEAGYIAVAADLTIEGKSVEWEGDLVDPGNPAKSVKGKFSLKC